METLVQLIFIIALVKYCLKAALSGSVWLIVGYAVAAAVVAMGLYPFVIEQSSTLLADMLTDKQTVADMALLTTAEAIAGIFLSLYLLDNYFMPKERRRRLAFVLKIAPGVLALCAIGYFELIFFKFRAGNDFLTTALLYAVLLMGGVLVVAFVIRYAMRGESLKLEVKVILNMAILVVGLLVSSSVADYNISHAQATIEWGALLVLVLGSLALVGLGAWFYKKQLFIKKQR